VKVVKHFFKLVCHLVKLIISIPCLRRQVIDSLTDKRSLFDLIPFILEEEKVRTKQSIQGQFLSVIFDGTSHSDEALAILVCFVINSWIIEQRLLAVQLLSKSLTGKEIAHELVQILSVCYGISSDYLVAAMRDRPSVNSVAMKTVKIIYTNALDVGCFSHAFDRVGEHFNILTLTEFIGNWLSLFHLVLRPNFCGNSRRAVQWHHIVLQGGGASGKYLNNSYISLVISNHF